MPSSCQALVSRGTFTWAGKSPLIFFRGGRLHTPWGSGAWSLAGEGVRVSLGPKCGAWALDFSSDYSSFDASATDGRETSGKLDVGGVAPRGFEDVEEGEGGPQKGGQAPAPGSIEARLLGSGPWAWSAVAPVGFFAGGRLLTPWAEGTAPRC